MALSASWAIPNVRKTTVSLALGVAIEDAVA
jgi:hypothetical protein